jgi:hypothetical protein
MKRTHFEGLDRFELKPLKEEAPPLRAWLDELKPLSEVERAELSREVDRFAEEVG